MALIKCPKCGKEFSDRAQACPQCGTSKEEVQRLIKERKEKEAEQERIRKAREAEDRKKYIKFAIALVIVLFTLFCGYVVYINTMPISARNSTELQSALQNPLRFSKEFVVKIPDGETSICDSAFYECSSLISIEIPNSVTSIGDYAFRDCTGLTSVTIPSSVTSIGVWAFAGCTGLTSVTIPNSITSIGDDAFGSIPNIVYNGSAAGAPWGARSLNGFVEGWFVYSDDTKNRLLACSSSASGDILIPNSVTSIGKYAFYECKSLTSVMIPNSVISIGDRAFFYCTGLRSVTIANGVTSIDRCAFWGRMSSLTLKIPERFRGKVNVSDCKEVIYY